MLVNPFLNLSDDDVETGLLQLSRLEREANADIILHLMVIKERRLYAETGFDSLFSYSTGKLGFSRSTAYRRKTIVDKADIIPSLIDRLRDGRLHLCAAAALAPYLEPETAEGLLDAVRGMSHREVESFLIKTWKPKISPPDSTPAAAAAEPPNWPARSPCPPGPSLFDSIIEQGPNRTTLRPLTEDTTRMSVTLSGKTLERFERVKELMPNCSGDEILHRALDALLDRIAPERRDERRKIRAAWKAKVEAAGRCGTVDQPQKAKTQSVPENRRRGSLAQRDKAIVGGQGRCSFRSESGQQCEARSFIEVDHIKPWALGGRSEAANLRPLCRAHNLLMAEKTFGPWAIKSSASKPNKKTH